MYSTDEYYEKNPNELDGIGVALLQDKESNVLGNETEYFANIKVPEGITEGRKVYMSVIMLYRYHLPFGVLVKVRPIVPVIVKPESSKSTFVVDSKFWTDGFVADYFELDSCLADKADNKPCSTAAEILE